MNTSDNECTRSEALRDYVFDELSATGRREMEQHMASCAACSLELSQLRLTTAALRTLPDVEIPQRIAFVSDKVFPPSGFSRFFGARFFGNGWAGFASAAVMGVALLFTALHRPAQEVRTVVQTAAGTDVSQQLDAAISRAVQQVRAEDALLTEAALAKAETKHQQEHRMLIVNMEQSVEVMQKRMVAMTSLASLEAPRSGGGQ